MHRSTSQTRVSASQGATPRTGTMSSRDLRAARAARSARSTSPSAKPRSSTSLKNGTAEPPPPLQTRSLLTFHQMSSSDDLDAGDRTAREPVARQHTLPSVSRRKAQQTSASAESRKSAVDDFQYEYRHGGSEKLATSADTPDDASRREDFARYRRDNLSQDSYRVSDSRDSSVDRLETRTKADDDVGDEDAEFIDNGQQPLDEAKLIEKLEQERQSRREMEEQDAAWLQRNDNDEEYVVNGDDDVHVVQAEWDLPESCLQTEVEKIVSIETTRIVETVETTRVTPVTETYRRQKRLSRENAVRVIDEDMTSSPAEIETCAAADDSTDSPTPEFAVPVSTDHDETTTDDVEIANAEQIKLFVTSLINDAIRIVRDVSVELTAEESAIAEPTEPCVTTAEKFEPVLSATDVLENLKEKVEEQTSTIPTDDISDETLPLANGSYKQEAENVPEENKELELNERESEYTAENQTNKVKIEANDVKQKAGVIDETSDEPLVFASQEVAQQSLTSVARPNHEVVKTAELPNDACTEYVSTSECIPPPAVTDQQSEEAVFAVSSTAAEETRTMMNQAFFSNETERQKNEEIVPGDLAEVCQSKQPPDEAAELQCKDAIAKFAAETADDIPYVLHKRHITTTVEKTTGDTRLYSTLPTRHQASRSRSLSPGHKKPAFLTSEQKRAQMMKVKASLVSMAAEMAALRSPKSPAGPTKRVFDFVVCSRLPPRDSFSSRDDTLSPAEDERGITLGPRDKKTTSTEKQLPQQAQTESSEVDVTSVEYAQQAVYLESESAKDRMVESSTSETFQLSADASSIEVTAVYEKVSLNADEVEGADGEKHTAETKNFQISEGLKSESESESKPVGDEAAASAAVELDDEVNRILSECEPNVAAKDNASIASGVSGKFTDESPEIETCRGPEANSQPDAVPTEEAVSSEDGAGVLSSLTAERSHAAAESHDEKLLQPSSSNFMRDNNQVADNFPAEAEVRPNLQALESHEELSVIDQPVNGVAMEPGDYELNETEALAQGGEVIANSDAELAAAEQRLLLELQANELHAAEADNLSSSSHSLNDQLDAEVLQSFVPAAVDAACRLSESSVDGPATCGGIGRNVHLLDWLEEQAQLRGVSSVSPSHHHDVISDEDDVEHGAVFEDNLQDIFAALEAEVMANPFLVPITPQTSDMCVNPMTSERFSFEDDSSLGALEASGGGVETTRNVESHDTEVLALSDKESKQGAAAGIAAEVEENVLRRASQLSLSISSEGEVVVEHVNDLTDPLEVLEIESRALPPQLRSKPVCLSSDSDRFSDKCLEEEEKLQDVADVLDRVDEIRRLSISDFDVDEQPPATADVHSVPLASDTMSSDNSSVGPAACVEEEPDALAVLEQAEEILTAAAAGDEAAELQPSNSDEDGPSAASSSSAVDSDQAAAFGNFVEQVMLHQSAAGSEMIFAADNDQTTELDPVRVEQFEFRADEDATRSEYTLMPSCDTEKVSPTTVAHETQLHTEVLPLPPGPDAAAISDEDDVEEDIEHSLDDVFAALEAEARRCSVPAFTAQTLLDIGNDSFEFDDDENTSSDLVHTDSGLTESVETVVARTGSEDTAEATNEHVAVEDSRQATAVTSVGSCQLSDDAAKCTEVIDAAVEEHPASLPPAEDERDDDVELLREDMPLTTETCNIKGRRDECFLSHLPEQGKQDDALQRDTNRQDSDAVHLSSDNVAALDETAEETAETDIPHVPESFQFDSKSTGVVNIGDRPNATVEPLNVDDEKVNASSVCTSKCVSAADTCVEQGAESTSADAAAEADTVCADDETKAADTSTKPATEASKEQRENIAEVTDSDKQS